MRPRAPYLLAACLLWAAREGMALGPGTAQENRKGEVAGTWCTQCNRLIPSGQSCTHMGGGSSPSSGGESLYAQRVHEYNTYYVEPFNAGIQLMNSARATHDQAQAINLYQQAIVQFQNALAFRPGDAAAQRHIASCQASIHCCTGQAAVLGRDIRGGIDHFCQAQRINPEGVGIWSANVAWALKRDRAHCVRTPDGKALVPEPGYTWVTTNPGDFRVKHIPGHAHPAYPHVVWTGEDESMLPAPGYRWVDGADKNNMATEPLPSGEAGPYPGTVWVGDGRSVRPAPGYVWATPQAPGNLRTVPAVRGAPVPGHPNLIASGDGRVGPASGYAWTRPGDRTNLEVKLVVSETKSETLKGLRAIKDGSYAVPRVGEETSGAAPSPQQVEFAVPPRFAGDKQIRTYLEQRAKILESLTDDRARWEIFAKEASELTLSPDPAAQKEIKENNMAADMVENRMAYNQNELYTVQARIIERLQTLQSSAGGDSTRDAASTALPLMR